MGQWCSHNREDQANISLTAAYPVVGQYTHAYTEHHYLLTHGLNHMCTDSYNNAWRHVITQARE
jgi:hypothetical protein